MSQDAAAGQTGVVPLLTVVVPAYDAAAYLHRALDPLVAFAAAHLGAIEVVVVDDGSNDGTGALADAYAVQAPEVVRVIHQRNAGHGGAINAGVAAATGRYLKVLDADDWLDSLVLVEVLAELARREAQGGIDLLVTDFTHVRDGRGDRVVRFDSVFPARRLIGWEQTARFARRQYLMMHAVIFRTALLRRSGLSLPEHTFYVDSLYVLTALAHTRRIVYLPVSLYRYVIGRAGQSVEADTMLRRVDQQLRVTRLALAMLPDPRDVVSGAVPVRLYGAMMHYVEALCVVTSATLSRGGTRAHLAQRQAFWAEVQAESPWLHARLRRTLFGASSNLPGRAGSRVTTLAYHAARRVVGFS
ncbi:glycosyltransferase family 2 protein [Microbacterium marinilacus]|uniref:Glycosyltransferase family 2 protein n=2 Tax=Microbacterium marinilacus TaxID=415209 RepID=A0ABP7BTG2_9MICO|nr:glycosyltransferase family 2 protein [Microbacterium marinilacus]